MFEQNEDILQSRLMYTYFFLISAIEESFIRNIFFYKIKYYSIDVYA